MQNAKNLTKKLHQNLCKKQTDISKQKKENWKKKNAKCKKHAKRGTRNCTKKLGKKKEANMNQKLDQNDDLLGRESSKKGTKNCATSLTKEHHIIKGEPKMLIVRLSKTHSLESN